MDYINLLLFMILLFVMLIIFFHLNSKIYAIINQNTNQQYTHDEKFKTILSLIYELFNKKDSASGGGSDNNTSGSNDNIKLIEVSDDEE